MDTKILGRSGAPDPGPPRPAVDAPPLKDVSQHRISQDHSTQRLIIEMDPASGSYVYTTIDWVTGQILQQLPRANVLRLRASADYTDGSVITTEA